jgi:hypothetical protein
MDRVAFMQMIAHAYVEQQRRLRGALA